MKEAIATVALYALLFASAASGFAGFALTTTWLGVGLYMVASSNSRGLWADVSFMVTWPIYWALGR